MFVLRFLTLVSVQVRLLITFPWPAPGSGVRPSSVPRSGVLEPEVDPSCSEVEPSGYMLMTVLSGPGTPLGSSAAVLMSPFEGSSSEPF